MIDLAPPAAPPDTKRATTGDRKPLTQAPQCGAGPRQHEWGTALAGRGHIHYLCSRGLIVTVTRLTAV